jgi:hypothetical protein
MPEPQFPPFSSVRSALVGTSFPSLPSVQFVMARRPEERFLESGLSKRTLKSMVAGSYAENIRYL